MQTVVGYSKLIEERERDIGLTSLVLKCTEWGLSKLECLHLAIEDDFQGSARSVASWIQYENGIFVVVELGKCLDTCEGKIACSRLIQNWKGGELHEGPNVVLESFRQYKSATYHINIEELSVIFNPEFFFFLAYSNIYAKEGNMTQGSTDKKR